MLGKNENVEQENVKEKKKFGVSAKELAGAVGEKAGMVAKKSTEATQKHLEQVSKNN